MTHASVAAKVRAAKEKWPLRYCTDPRCLWNLSSGPCPKHMKEESKVSAPIRSEQQRATQSAWVNLLAQQQHEREVLAQNHQEQRELFYRANKPTMDSYHAYAGGGQ